MGSLDIISAFRRQGQGYYEFKASSDDIVRSFMKTNNEQTDNHHP